MPRPTIYTGTFIHTPSLGSLEVLENAAIFVDKSGVIVSILKNLSTGELEKKRVEKGEEWLAFERSGGQEGVEGGRWWCPGFVDTHIHASQHPNAGIFGRSTLLDWLNTYTFPLESSLSSLPTARRTYTRCVDRTLSHGTTTAAYFATTHVPATNLLADICLAKGQRAFVGRVCMDSDLSPEYYRDASPEQALRDTEATVKHMLEIDPGRETVCPIVTPRFAPSCSAELLGGLGKLAKERDLPIQTHISENPSECKLVGELFPEQEHYAGVYDKHGLLTPRTVLAHAIHLSAGERKLVKQRGSAISHCPVSNTSLSSGLCPVRELLDEGISVGLGTDVSGGYSSSILVAAREAGMVSRIVAGLEKQTEMDAEVKLAKSATAAADVVGGLMDKIGLEKKEDVEGSTGGVKSGQDPASVHKSNADRKKLTVEECLYLATMGGAQCLGLAHKIGSVEVGKQWDAQLIEVDVVPEDESIPESGQSSGAGGAASTGQHGISTAGTEATEEDKGLVEVWGRESWDEKVAKWVFCGDDRNTRLVFVGGKLVHQRIR